MIVLQLPWKWIIGIALACLAAIWYMKKIAMRLLGENIYELSFREFSCLKDLDESGFKWIARDYNGKLHAFEVRPKRVRRKGIFYVWRMPENLKLEGRTIRIREEYFSQIGRFEKTPCQISEMLYAEGTRR